MPQAGGVGGAVLDPVEGSAFGAGGGEEAGGAGAVGGADVELDVCGGGLAGDRSGVGAVGARGHGSCLKCAVLHGVVEGHAGGRRLRPRRWR